MESIFLTLFRWFKKCLFHAYMDYVAPNLTDGLGNRLFKFACAKQYAEKYKKKLVFFLPRCGKTDHGAFENIFRLFPEVPILESANAWNEINELTNFVHTEIEKHEGILIINGYRQSWKYFADTIIEPNFENCIGKERLEYLDNKYLTGDDFCVHVRLGDYRTLPHHQINIAKYYVAALQRVPEANILLFSDEPELVKGLFTIPHTIVDESEVECLYLMSKCLKGAVVGNSTFSYWGAYLAHQKSKDHIAYYPDNMGQGLPELVDYVPPWGIILEA